MSRSLLTKRRFLPLFATQALGAVNDNLFKNALVVMVMIEQVKGASLLVQIASGIFILPYALFSATAGQLADRFDKSRLIRVTKLLELAVMVTAAIGFWLDSPPILLAVLFGLGLQATFFGPLKYGILPEHLAEDELVTGNAQIEAGTFGGIILGTILGGWLVALDRGPLIVAGCAIALALAGTVAAFSVPRSAPAAPDLKIGWNLMRETIALVRGATRNRTIWLSILGISWFWNFGAIVLAQFPVIASETLHADAQVITLLLAMFAIGVGVGSILVGRLLKGEISARHVPFAALGLSVFTLDFAFVCGHAGNDLTTVTGLLLHPQGWHMLVDLVLLAMCGGVYSVPLYAIVQDYAPPSHRARILAANNIVNAAFIVAGAGVSAGLAAAGLASPWILAIAAIVNLGVTAYMAWLLPKDVMRVVFRWYFERVHGVTVSGLEHLANPAERRVFVINHQSLLDGCLVATYLPSNVTFAVDTATARQWWAQALLWVVDRFEVDPTNPYALKQMIRTVREGRALAIFPEGRLTRTGALMKIYEGAGAVADRADAVLVPVHIEGLQFTRLSRMGGKVRKRWFPPIELKILPPVRLAVPPEVTGRRRREAVGTALHRLMIASAFAAHPIHRPIFAALCDAAGRYGWSTTIIEDVERRPLTYRALVTAVAVLGRKLAARSPVGEPIAVLLPNAAGAVVSMTALWAFGRVPQPLNFTAGADGMLATCTATGVRLLVTSRRFIERAKLESVLARLAEHLTIVWLEDLRGEITRADKLRGWLDGRLPRRLPGASSDPEKPAVVLSTSGSEGSPKAVLLSHRALVANCAQLAATVDFNPSDRVLNAMPMFHAFGLTGGTILPLLYGVPSFLYPSPLHFKIVPEVAYGIDATILFGTDTFLTGWARFAHPYDFYAVRYIFAGAEKVREETRRLYAERFGVRVLEGYGATETAPVIAINTAMLSRPGSVGQLLPGIEAKLEPVSGIETGGRLWVRGPNVMTGYMRAAAPGMLEPPVNGWYDTGDIVAIDAAGFVTIQGRAKRFAKIAGEMVSMTAAEALAQAVWPENAHAVVAVPDPRKGEALVLVTTAAGADAAALVAAVRGRGTAEIMVPRRVQTIVTLPLLGTGKVDYVAVQKLVDGSPDPHEIAAEAADAPSDEPIPRPDELPEIDKTDS